MRIAAVLALALLLSGCAGKPATASADEPVPEGCHRLRGVVVDDAIRPIAGALVEWPTANLSVTTDDQGTYEVPCLPAGTHVVRASHPLYSTVQQAVEVAEDDAEPPLVKLLLVRVIFDDPYTQVQLLEGFLVCSVGFSIYASEECGEGVGVPCEVPEVGCQRYGGQTGNRAQLDFWLDGPLARTMIVEMQWEPSSPTVSEFQLNLGNDWSCDPFCNGNALNVTGGTSPLYATVDFPRELTDKSGTPIELTSETRFSTMVWPNWGSGDPQQLNVAINQAYDVFVTTFYVIPAPAGFSLLAGDIPPY